MVLVASIINKKKRKENTKKEREGESKRERSGTQESTPNL
jgi:hypothetical protein